MGLTLTATEWESALRDYAHTAFRLELQPRYYEPDEEPNVQRFLAGDPQPPDELAEWREWFDQVAAQVAEGKRMERVRVQEDPPTPYQRWERWIGRWSVEAGEQIRYMTRQRAHEIGLLPAAGTEDWWLLDSMRLVVMRFDAEGHRIGDEMVTDPQKVVQACAWRDLAVHHSTPDPPG